MRCVLTLLILAAPSTPLAPPATKPPSSRDVGRLVNEAATIEEALATARLLPLAGEETQHWETQDVHIARRRKSLTALLRRVTRWTVGGAAAEAMASARTTCALLCSYIDKNIRLEARLGRSDTGVI